MGGFVDRAAFRGGGGLIPTAALVALRAVVVFRHRSLSGTPIVENHTYTPSLRKPPCQSTGSYVLRHGQAWRLSLPLDIMVSAKSVRRSLKAMFQ